MARGNGHDQRSNVASLAEARARAARASRAPASGPGASRSRTVKERLVGGVLIAMAAGFLVSLALPLVKG